MPSPRLLPAAVKNTASRSRAATLGTNCSWYRGARARGADPVAEHDHPGLRVARMTAHKLLGVLVDEGLIVAVPGVGPGGPAKGGGCRRLPPATVPWLLQRPPTGQTILPSPPTERPHINPAAPRSPRQSRSRSRRRHRGCSHDHAADRDAIPAKFAHIHLRPRRCLRTWRIARYGRSSSRTTVLGLVLSLRPSAIRVLNGL